MAEYSTLEKIRLQKIEELRAEGVDPYPTRAERTHTSAQVIAEFEAAEKNAAPDSAPEVKATLAGRIRASRAMGKVSFAHIEDVAARYSYSSAPMSWARNAWIFSTRCLIWAILSRLRA